MVQKKLQEQPLEQIHEIDMAEIEISPDNVRHNTGNATKDLDELAASIKLHGLLQPVVLIGEIGKPPYQLIAGQRRFLAHELLGRTVIRAVFAANKLSKAELIVRSLVENLQRVELEYKDTAEAVTFLYKKLGSDRAVHKATGLSLRKVRDFILIEARATPGMKKLLENGKAKAVDVKRAIVAAQDDLKKAETLLNLIIEKTPTTDQKRRIVSYGQTNKDASATEIFKEGVKTQVEQSLIVTLPEPVREALGKAVKIMDMDVAELATKILADWLTAQGYIQ
jgi:ParB/RepB/Spo0J family partition protein